jgi:signal transduction histidine kinase/ABC-type amino acid transport substrate-binding protein/ActR/RegA family two-component response regulator
MKLKNIVTWGLAGILALSMPINTFAAENEAASETEEVPETVKVAFFALDGYHEINSDGIRSGYGYDIFHQMEKYSNLNFEFVDYDITWEETLQKVLDGEIDIATTAYKTEDRTELYDFSMPIGTSSITINTRADETRFVPEDYTTYDGMTVGLLSGYIENEMFEEFAENKGFRYKAKYYDNSTDLQAALSSGEVDAVATTSLRKIENEKVLSTFDTQEFYAILKKGNTELLDKLNYAITQLNSSEGDWKNTFYYNNYTANNYSSINFTAEEQEFIDRYSKGGDKLVIAMDNDWKPFSWYEDGDYKGILPEYIRACMDICGMDYTYYDYEGSVFNATLENMANVDLYACYGLPDNDDDNGLLASDTFIENGCAYLQRRDTFNIEKIAIALTTQNLNKQLIGNTDATIVEYEDTAAAKQAVLDGDVDAAFLYGYDAEYTVNQDKTGKLVFTMLPENPMEIRAVMSKNKDHRLMSILMKCINYMPDTQKNSITSKYVSFSVTGLSFSEYIMIHPILTSAICVLIVGFIFIIGFVLLKNRTEKRYRISLEVKVDEITNLNDQLHEKQEKLEETSAEQEAQMEEIIALNDELEEKQEQLEETSAEQEAQLEEITALNDELECQHEKLEEACKQAESANNAKTSFLFNMSHDIRTPMNAIIGFADLLEKHQDEPEKRKDYLKKIQDSSAVLLSIINNVLEMARIEKGTVVIDEAAWSAEQFNDTLYSVFQDMMREKDIEFTRDIAVDHQYVLCDPIKLREVFINILSNAYKYTNSGGKVHMHLEEIPSDREGYAMYRTTISDTGMGMTDEFLPHIFEEFSRENNTTDNKIEGTGLGMPIVKRLVDIMGGTITVKSKKGEGTTFEVTIPHKITDKSKLVTHNAVEFDTNVFKGKRILLAEDNELNAEIAIELLTEEGFVVDRASDGQVCVDMLDKSDDNYYDVILMDIQMPNMNGYEATKAIRKFKNRRKSNIPIIAMTANAFEEDKRDAIRAGMDGHLAKPVDARELCKTLMGIFNCSEARKIS